MSALKNVKEARVVHVAPDDVIFLKVDRYVTPHIAAKIKAQAKRIWPDNEIVVGVDMDITVVRPA